MPIVDRDLPVLAKLKNLKSLSLGSTQGTNAGLRHLTKLKHLEASTWSIQRLTRRVWFT